MSSVYRVRFVDWLMGSLDKVSGYERYRVLFIMVVPFLINGSGYKKPGLVAQKRKMIQMTNKTIS